MSIDRRKAYYYRWTGEPKFSGIAVDVHVHTGTGGKELRFISPPERPDDLHEWYRKTFHFPTED